MPALLIALFAALRSTVRSPLELEAEVLALRHQLAVLQRQAPRRPRLGYADRFLWVVLSRVWSNWRHALQIVTPDTVVDWRRRGFALYWLWKSRPRRSGRPAVTLDILALIRQMQAANPPSTSSPSPPRRFAYCLCSSCCCTIDEVGYVPLAELGAELLFQIIADRSEQAAVILTTNLPFSEWTQVIR
jgi:hypothetical protein